MTNRSAALNRDDATRRVMLAIAVGPKPVNLPFTAEDGSKPLIVTTPGEYLSQVIARVMAIGGHANVALAEVSQFNVFQLEADDQPQLGATDDEVSEDISMGMFVLKANQGKRKSRLSTVFYVRGGGVRMPMATEQFAYAV